MNSIWKLKECNEEKAQVLSNELGVSLTFARLLIQRGLYDVNSAMRYMNPDLDELGDPYLLSGMSKAVERINKAVNIKEKVIIYGDYDVDGICSTVLLIECFNRLGLEVDYYIPNRFNEGYGLNKSAVNMLIQKGYNLLITVDCGISSIEEIKIATSMGMDVIVTDHHIPGDTSPEAYAVIDPKNDNVEGKKDLAGVGVAFNLAFALCKSFMSLEEIYEWLDLVALATVADIVPLKGENRIIVKHGLDRLQQSKRQGLMSLIKEAGLENKPISSWHLAFILAPRINAAGRMDNAGLAVELLLSSKPEQAVSMASLLCDLNKQRREVEDQILEQAIEKINTTIELEKEKVLVIAGEGWHLGVIGIVASKLLASYNRPVIIIAKEGEMARGSARSMGDFNIFAALNACSKYLLNFGGHRMAGGLSLDSNQIANFKRAINDYIAKNEIYIPETPEYIADIEMEIDDIGSDLLKEIKNLEPFGEANPSPKFILRANELIYPTLVGKNKEHIKFKTMAGKCDAIAFNHADILHLPLKYCNQDMLFELEENEFRGYKNLQMKVKDIKCSFTPDNLSKEISCDRETIEVIERAVDEMKRLKPVMFIYPTQRSLNKHYDLIKYYLKTNNTVALHGHLSLSEKQRAQQRLEKGDNKVFLITQAFFKKFCQYNDLPKNLQYLAMWGIQEINIDLELLRRKYEIKTIDNPRSSFECGTNDFQLTDDGSKTIIYANRSKTVNQLKKQIPGVIVETGEKDIVKRRALRRKFLSSHSAVLVSDGTHTAGLNLTGIIDSLIMIDLPFGEYELAALIPSESNKKVKNFITIDEKKVYNNKFYLNRIYPDKEIVNDVLNYFVSKNRKHIKEESNKLAVKIGEYLNKDVKSADLYPVMRILEDLGLCEWRKEGSIIAIKFINVENSRLSLSDSSYYLEGFEEKRVFSNWLKKIN